MVGPRHLSAADRRLAGGDVRREPAVLRHGRAHAHSADTGFLATAFPKFESFAPPRRVGKGALFARVHALRPTRARFALPTLRMIGFVGTDCLVCGRGAPPQKSGLSARGTSASRLLWYSRMFSAHTHSCHGTRDGR